VHKSGKPTDENIAPSLPISQFEGTVSVYPRLAHKLYLPTGAGPSWETRNADSPRAAWRQVDNIYFYPGTSGHPRYIL